MNISIDKSLSDCIDKGSWTELLERTHHFENLDTLCYIAHIAVSQKKYDFLRSAVSRKEFPFYQKINYDGKFVPILHRAMYAQDTNACNIILSSGALALCCAQKCSEACFDTFDILYELSQLNDMAFSDIVCLLVSSWTKFLQNLRAASESSNVDHLKSLLDQLKKYACTHRWYTDLCLRLDSMEHEDLREFTLLCMDPDSVPGRQHRFLQNAASSSTRNFFTLVAEGAGKALSAFMTVGDQFLGGSSEEMGSLQANLLEKTRNMVAQLTQRFLNSMLISAIERADFPIIHLLMDFGFRLQSVPRPSMCFPNPVDILTIVNEKRELGHRRNPLDLHLDTPGGPDWLLTALRVNEDTPFLAVIRKNLLQDNVFNRLLKEGPHLLMLPGAGGVLPIHLISALGRIEMLRELLKSHNSTLDLVEDCGLSALLISAFYGHIECVCAILDHPCEETEMTISQDPDVSHQHDPSLSSSLSSICPVDALKSAPMNWYFRPDGSNTLVVGAMRRAIGKHFIGASFNSLHLAILTGNLELLECLLTYVKEDPEDYGDWLLDAVCVQTNERTSSESTPEEDQLLANLDSSRFLCNPAGLACCLDDIDCVNGSLTSDVLRLLSTVQNQKTASSNKLLNYLLGRQRFHLVGGLLYQQQHANSRNVIDWSNLLFWDHLPSSSRDSDTFSTLITDWLSWSTLDTITKLNISNNALCDLPLCLFIQLPALEELDLSRNAISSLPDLASLEEFANLSATAVLAPNLTRLDLSSNFLPSIPPWLFGTTTVSGKAEPRFAPRLSDLRLCGNKLRSIPRQMWLARCLRCLDLSSNALTELPQATVEETLSAATLRSESCDEKDLNKERDISCLPQLPNSFKVMSMFKSDKDLAIPNSKPTVSYVEPSSDHRWNGGLLHLWLQGNRLFHLPLCDMSTINQRHSLTVVGDSRKTSQELCSEGVGLPLLAPALVSLDVSGNRLSGSLPSPSRFPPKMVYLDLSNNQITSVGMLNERKLESNDDNSTNQDRNLSTSASDGQFKNLLHLNLRNNKISTFNPTSYSNEGCESDSSLWFPELASLDLSGNTELRSLGPAVCRLEKLSSLELDGCTSLTELPAGLWRLFKLKSLTLFNTPAYDRLVREIRAEEINIHKYSRQRQRYQQQRGRKNFVAPTSNTPLMSNTSSKPSEIPILNTKTILEHLKSLPRSSKPYNKVRLMLIGSPSAAKINLIKALLHSEDQDPHIIKGLENSSTPIAGLTVTPLRITRRCPAHHDRSEWTDTIDFTVWDFHTPSGSEEEVESVLSAVQQFLMSKSTIYIVVWNAAEAPDGFHVIARHIVDIQTRASNAPVVLVTTHNDLPPNITTEVSDVIDRCFLHSPDPSAMGFSQQIVGHFLVDPTDLNGNNNLDTIYRIATTIHSAANFLRPPFRKPLIGTRYELGRQRLLSYPVPLVYHDLEIVTRDLANDLHMAGIPPIISLDNFVSEVNIRLQVGNTSSGLESQEEIRSALAFLHEAGHLLYFANFTQAIVLDPLWLCDLLLRLLTLGTGVQSVRAGVLNLSRLKDLLTSPKIPNTIDPKSSSAIDRLMHRFQHLEVSFALTYLVSLLAKFELVAPLDSQHLLVPALLPLRRLADLNSNFSNAPKRQIRLTPLSNSDVFQSETSFEALLKDSDPLDCTVYTLPRKNRSKKSTPLQLSQPIAEESSVSSLDSFTVAPQKWGFFSKLAFWQTNFLSKSRVGRHRSSEVRITSQSSSFDQSDRLRQAQLCEGPSVLRQPLLPPWKLQAAEEFNEVLRIYALSYVPAGFWTRLITRLLTDSDLNVICGHLYNLATVTPELRASLLTLEKGPSYSQTLQSGWSLSRMGIQMTLAGGALPVLTLEQVGNRVSFATASIEQTEVAVEAKESTGMLDLQSYQEDGDSKLLDDKSALGGLDGADFKAWNLYLMRFPTGCAEEFRGRLREIDVEEAKTSGLIVEAFDDFAKYCLIQIHMPSFSVHWSGHRGILDPNTENCFDSFSLHPDRRVLAQILTKVVHHIDCLLEDWYPDLGTRFNQSNSGEHLVYRVIPCTDCVRNSLYRLNQAEDVECAVSTLDSVLGVESSLSSEMKCSSVKHSENLSHIVYGILVEEFVHWLLTPARKKMSLDLESSYEILSCPFHPHATHSGISAPDLLFQDVRTEMKIDGSKVMLEKFLGRGAFGSVFAGSAFFAANPSSKDPTPFLNLVKVPVGVKICSPINPSEIGIYLNDWQLLTDQDDVKDDPMAVSIDSCSGKSGTSDLRVALALYKQEKRRWSFQPVEACYTAYQELRSELAVLMRVADDVPIPVSGYSSGSFSAPYNSSTFRRSNSYLLRSSRRATLRRSSVRSHNYPKLFYHNTGSRGFIGRTAGRHLLSCLGVVSPRPLCLLLPLAPKGSLSDWMQEMKSLYETEGIYPVHQNTLTAVVHQVATAIAYLHRVRIVYRDLKPDNLLVWQMPPPITLPSNSSANGTLRNQRFFRSNNLPSEVRVVLSDFGVSRWRANLDGCRGYVGTPGFMAPEVLASMGEETYTHKVDIYALGILMASAVTFQLPYHGFTNLRFQLNQHIISGGRPDIPSKIKLHCSVPYLDLMSLCWSHEPQQRPEASSIVTVTQSPLPVPPLSVSASPIAKEPAPNIRGRWRQAQLPVTVETGFDQINNVLRIDAVEVVTCAVIDSEDQIWIGGYSTPPESDHALVGDAFFSRLTSANRIGRLLALTEKARSFHCGLVCSWSSRRSEGRDYLPKPSPLPLNLQDFGHPVALAIGSDGHLWCADSVGRLMVFSTLTLSLLASTSLLRGSSFSMDGDCLWMFPIGSTSLILGLSTGWICFASLKSESISSPPAIFITWSLNSLRQSRRMTNLTGSCLYLCGARVLESFIWLGGTSCTLTEFQQLPNSDAWQQTFTWKADTSKTPGTGLLSLTTKISQKSTTPHNCGRLCDGSMAVTCITSTWNGSFNGEQRQRAWTYSYPDSEITCWSVRTRAPLQSIILDPQGGNLQFRDSTSAAFPDITSSIGNIENLLWMSENGLILACTSRGTLLKIHWPVHSVRSTKTDSDIDCDTGDDDDFADGSSLTPGWSSASPLVVARVLRLHRGPAERCFHLLSGNRSLGRGFVHPLHRCFENSSGSDASNYGDGYFIVSLLREEDLGYGCDIGERE